MTIAMGTPTRSRQIFGSIRGGGCIGLAFEWLVLATGQFVRVLLHYVGQTLKYHIVYPGREYMPATVQVMIKCLQAIFAVAGDGDSTTAPLIGRTV